MPNHTLVLQQAPPSAIVQGLLSRIRPEWKVKRLIERVQNLLVSDPSSACQRLLNAAFHDLREKVVLAGLDIAKQAAEEAKLPPVNRAEDAEAYPADKLLDLAYAMGLLSRAEWRRVKRCYDIRRDLEHEDDQYEANVEDCVYIFMTCVEVVLAKHPVHLLKVVDVKEVVERPTTFSSQQEFLDDFERAPEPRQLEILKFLVSTALKENNADLVRQNAHKALKFFAPAARSGARLALAAHLQERLGRSRLTLLLAKVADAAGVMPYLKESKRKDFYHECLERLHAVGHAWASYAKHQQPLGELLEVGGLAHCPDGEVLVCLCKWLLLCFVGTRGGRTSYGNFRPAYYSDVAEPLIERLVGRGGERVREILRRLRHDPEVRGRLASCAELVARYDQLLAAAAGGVHRAGTC